MGLKWQIYGQSFFCSLELVSSASWLALLREPEQAAFMEMGGLWELAFCRTDGKINCKAGYKVMPLLVQNRGLSPHCILQWLHGWALAKSTNLLHFLPADTSVSSPLPLLLQLHVRVVPSSASLRMVMNSLPKFLFGLASVEPPCWGGAGSLCMASSAVRPDLAGGCYLHFLGGEKSKLQKVLFWSQAGRGSLLLYFEKGSEVNMKCAVLRHRFFPSPSPRSLEHLG